MNYSREQTGIDHLLAVVNRDTALAFYLITVLPLVLPLLLPKPSVLPSLFPKAEKDVF